MMIYSYHRFLLYLTLFLWHLISPVKCIISWTLKTRPVVFGENVTLFCKLPNNFSKVLQRKWKSGSDLLTFNEKPLDLNKYSGTLEQTGFTLTIQNFQENDFRKEYTCWYDFERHTENLPKDNYQWNPGPGTYGVTIVNPSFDYFGVEIQFQKVYPIPKCNLFIQKNLTNQSFSNSTHVIDKYFLAVNLTLEYQYGLFDCSQEAAVICYFGNKLEILRNFTTPRNCSDVCQQKSPCLKNSTCVSDENYVRCDCMEGYHAKRCELREDTADDIDTNTATDPGDSNAGMIVAIVLTIAILVVGVVCYVVVFKLKKQPKVLKSIKETRSRDEETSEKVDKDPSPQEKDCTKENGATNETHEATESVPLTNMQN